MTSVSDLKDGERGRVGYVLFIEGIPQAFTDEPELAGSGASSWIGTSYGAREVLHGLDWDSITVGLDWQTGMLNNDQTAFEVLDVDGVLAGLFATEPDSDDLEPLGEQLDPNEDPAPATKLLFGTIDGTETVNLWGRHVGIEYIGSAGERRQFYVTPDHVTLGAMQPAPLDHPVIDHENGANADAVLPPVLVSDSPYTWAGRAVALYAIHEDVHDGGWPAWHLQAAGGALVWYGKLRDQAKMVGPRKWSLEVDGPQSWQQKLLNAYRPSAPFEVRNKFSLDDGTGETVREDAIYVGMSVGELPNGSFLFGERKFLDGDDLSATDVQALRTEINAIIAAAIAANTNWADLYGDGTGSALFAPDGTFRISWKDDSVGDYFGSCAVVMHRKVWARLGWDPVLQGQLDYSDPRWAFQMSFVEVVGLGAPDADEYLGIRFSTVPQWGTALEILEAGNADNNGAPRIYEPVWGGQAVELDPKKNQTLAIGGSSSYVYCEGQKARPPAEGFDATSFWAFAGQIQRAGESEPRDYVQVAKCSYDLTGNRMDTDSEGRIELRVDTWLTPRNFGFDYEKMEEAWLNVVGGIHAYPLAVIGGYRPEAGQGTGLDEAHRVLGRLHSSSGTASAWSSHDQDEDAAITVGENDPDGTSGDDFEGGDLEIQDLGLNLPTIFVDYESMKDAAKHLPNGGGGPGMGRVKVSSIGPVQAQDVIRDLLRARGWATRWAPQSIGSSSAPAFGLFAKFATISQEEVEVVITRNDIPGDAKDPMSWVPQQKLRFAQPVDSWSYKWKRDPLTRELGGEVEFQSRDAGVRHRRGDVNYTVEDPYSPDTANALGQTRSRLQNSAARWYHRRHFPLTFRLFPDKAQQCGIGTVVRLTNPDPVDSTGAYGITNRLGRVISKNFERGQFAEVTVLVQADNPNNTKHWAPMAMVYGWDVSGSDYTLEVAGPSAESSLWAAGDAFEKDDGKSDALGFAEPSWSTTGGTAKVQIHQSTDYGKTWGNRVTGDVVSVDTDNHQVVINNVSGTLLRDADKILTLRPYDEQDADSWPRAVYSFVVASNGKAGGVKGRELS